MWPTRTWLAAAQNSGYRGALAQALARNVYAEASEPRVAAAQLAAYVRLAVETLDRQPLEDVARGAVRPLQALAHGNALQLGRHAAHFPQPLVGEPRRRHRIPRQLLEEPRQPLRPVDRLDHRS